jgi:hypothetical protein
MQGVYIPMILNRLDVFDGEGALPGLDIFF